MTDTPPSVANDKEVKETKEEDVPPYLWESTQEMLAGLHGMEVVGGNYEACEREIIKQSLKKAMQTYCVSDGISALTTKKLDWDNMVMEIKQETIKFNDKSRKRKLSL